MKQTNPNDALLAYRATPINVTGYSPSQLIMGRNLRTSLPMRTEELIPKWPPMNRVKENDEKSKLRSAENYNKRHGVRALPEIAPGSEVRVRLGNDKQWSDKTTVQQALNNRSYIVRNRRFLQSCPIIDKFHQNTISSNDTSASSNDCTSSSQEPYFKTRYGRVIKPVFRYGIK